MPRGPYRSTLKWRLDAGRDCLPARLARRGFAGSAGLAALTALQTAQTSLEKNARAAAKRLAVK